ncbi:lasso peptide biosynthesis B2 protein [Novosphingobium flavum]|uniref:Lasso peptide biosynthesis B2 protein n=1 Tax=Novosphingobium flavum TaxID=1778672 RepID=A0A7X1FPM1_9SPHN|nr:lasso peptide biosynthesis B2 protein [Novosphingobium flavum]MBC2664625.1 lasso peptide biosynthesis B2 protein [Novosphingobium flavum]
MSLAERPSPSDPPGTAALRRRHRARVAEAALWLVAARLLVSFVPLARWQSTLGQRVPPDAPMPAPGEEQALRSRRAGRAVERAARLLPLELKCLPRAMALQWMLRRRRIASRLMIGILPAGQRGSVDDLHAWVISGTDIVIGELPLPHRTVLALQCG